MAILNRQNSKPELLSPAGSMESFFASVENGADAVYFGLESFSARASARNFSLDDASKAIAYAHKKAIKVYITLNTLIKTTELEKVVDILMALEEIRPDSIILQDLGLLYLIQSKFPGFNIHASTQMSIHNLAGVKQLEKLGFKRVVLARELSVTEIKHIATNISTEIEVFVHGALCYSYSGLCFFSSMIGGRSGNRGRCAQPCRMHYHSQSDEGGYLFSMKDLNTLSEISDLVAAGVSSLKIEGRMKSPEYVAVVTDAYRKAIDGEQFDQQEAVDRIKTVFSRETTSAYLKEANNLKVGKGYDISSNKSTDIINPSYPANMGLYAGVVIKSKDDHIVLRAAVSIGVRDLLQVFEDGSVQKSLLHVKSIKVNGKRVFSVVAGDVASINVVKKIKVGAKAYVVSSQKTKEALAQKVPKKLALSKIPVELDIRIKSDKISVSGNIMEFTFDKDYPLKVDRGINRTIDSEDVKGCFSRLGETPFELAIMNTDISNGLFVPLGILNNLRRDYFKELSTAWRKERRLRGDNIKKWLKEKLVLIKEQSTHNSTTEEKTRLSIKIDRLDYLDGMLTEEIYRLYIVLSAEIINYLQKDEDVIDKLLKEKDKVVFSLPFILRGIENGIERYNYLSKMVHSLIALGFRKFQISNLWAISLFDGEDVQLHADYTLYALNSLSIIKLRELGFIRYTLSPEDDKGNQQTLFSDDTDLIVYQDTPLFTSEACVWANMKGECPGISQCGFKQVALTNEHGDHFMAINDECRTVVMGEKPFSLLHIVPLLIEDGHRDYRIDLCYKDYSIKVVSNIISGINSGKEIRNSTIGNFERGLL
ncbi:MAG: U32 family peptidase [Candidatus Brocadiaceae bacterium]|nr:U32 family peptidase [Candidatus Brocadiaceae bacterium]